VQSQELHVQKIHVNRTKCGPSGFMWGCMCLQYLAYGEAGTEAVVYSNERNKQAPEDPWRPFHPHA
jgi:hypothetical protein